MYFVKLRTLHFCGPSYITSGHKLYPLNQDTTFSLVQEPAQNSGARQVFGNLICVHILTSSDTSSSARTTMFMELVNLLSSL